MFLNHALRHRRRIPAVPAAWMLALFLLPMTGLASSSGKLTLTWSANSEPDISGYRLYYGNNSGSYSSRTDVGLKTVYTVEGLEQGNYFFVITAYNTSGQESGYSNEVAFYLPPSPKVSSISETQGPAGMEIAVLGENLIQGTVITFNGIPAPVVLVNSNKALVTVPTGFSSGPITIATPGGSVDAGKFTVTPAQFGAELTLHGNGAAQYSTVGPSNLFQAGYATLAAKSGSLPGGIAFLSYSQEDSISSMAGFTTATPTRSAKIFADHRLQFPAGTGTVDIKTGFSIVNPGMGNAGLQFSLRNQSGALLGTSTLTLAPGEHVAKFLDDLFEVPERFGLGSLEIGSDIPVSIAALRLTVSQSGRLLLSTLPVTDMTKNASVDPLYFPLMNAGAGFQTSLLLLNRSDQVETGRIILISQSGTVLNLVNTPAMSRYRIQPGGVSQLLISSTGEKKTGWVKVIPDVGSQTPEGAELIGFSAGGTLKSETCFPAASPTNRALLYVDESGAGGNSLAFANPGSPSIHVEIKGLQSDVRAPSLDIPSNGSTAGAFRDIVQSSLPGPFTGILDVRSTAPFVAVNLKTLVNKDGDVIFTGVPVLDPASVASSPAVFPQIADGQGYETDFVVLNSQPDDNLVQLGFWNNSGKPLAAGK